MMPRVMIFSALLAVQAYAQPTFNREISRILQAKCQQCHREKDIAPMALRSFDDAVTWAADIKRVLNEGLMPPWKPVDGHGSFKGAYPLTPQERQDLLAWIDGGTPEGDAADAPEPLPSKGDWVLGDPDAVLKMKESYRPIRGKDIYRCFVIDPQLDADKFVSAVDILPGNRASVHHVILYLDTSGEAEKLDAADDGPGYSCYGGPGTPLLQEGFAGVSLDALSFTLGGWAPGARPQHLPEGVGMSLSKRSKIVMQIHYYTNASTEPDQTSIGLYYSKGPVSQRLLYLPLIQTRLDIPAGNAKYTATANLPIPPFFDMHVVNIFPHMHLLGTDIKVEANTFGKTNSLIWIDKWDFNWQGAYTYTEPVPLSAFTNLRATCTYDNSAANPRNPSNPPKRVRWGEGTEDEMCVVFLGVTLDRETSLFRQPAKQK